MDALSLSNGNSANFPLLALLMGSAFCPPDWYGVGFHSRMLQCKTEKVTRDMSEAGVAGKVAPNRELMFRWRDVARVYAGDSED